jgi:hypothetical protein
MEQFGSHYAVMLHDPQLREGLIRLANQSPPSRRDIGFRRWLAQALRALAARLDPRPAALGSDDYSIQSGTLQMTPQASAGAPPIQV